MASLICAHLLSILLAGGLRFGASAILPGADETIWRGMVGLAALGMVAAIFVESRRGMAPWQSRGRLLLWLVFPGAAALHWSLGDTAGFSSPDVPALAVILGLASAALIGRNPEWARRELTRAGWRAAALWLLAPTTLVIGVGITQGMSLSGRTGLALATYPIYAAAQLGPALLLPWTQWERDGVPPVHRVVTLSILFGLVHWPNPFAVTATAIGMALWATAWHRGSAFIPVALSMGILAAVATQGLPNTVTGHMRVGPNYVIRAHEIWLDGEAWRLNQAGRWSDEEGLRPWLTRALAAYEGEDLDPALVEEVALTLERMHRASAIRWIFDSGEFRWRHDFDEPFRDDELRFFESTFVPFHPGHAGYDEILAGATGLSTGEFIRLAYQTWLGREPKESEYRYWPRPITAGNRWLFLRRVVEGGGLRGWNEPDYEDPVDRFRATQQARR